MSANSSGGQGCVMMVCSINPEKINCDTVFNLFCLYGNIVRAMFLKTKGVQQEVMLCLLNMPSMIYTIASASEMCCI